MAARACAGGQICVRLHNSEGVVVSLNGDVGLTRGSGGGRFGERALVNRVARATKAAFGTQTGLCRHSNRSLFASRNRAGKRFAEARDWGGILGDSGRFQVTEPALSRVSAGKAAESQRLFRRRQETGIAQECVVVGPAGPPHRSAFKDLPAQPVAANTNTFEGAAAPLRPIVIERPSQAVPAEHRSSPPKNPVSRGPTHPRKRRPRARPGANGDEIGTDATTREAGTECPAPPKGRT
jgi:hypothetical protein